jgi:hypothetical protein
MKLIYEASNTIEAHMILNLLEQAGISGRIDGEYLQGGIGELQAGGFARVMVDDSDYDAANGIVKEWDASQSDRSESDPVKKNNSFSSGVIGFILGIIVVAIFYNTPITSDGIDYNGDGILDEKWTFIDGRISKTEIDGNLDGNIDLIHKYDRQEFISSSKADDDFNGVFETRAKYSDGNMVWSESDTNNDGFYDYRMDFEFGRLDTITFIDPITEKVLKIQKYGSTKMISAEVDIDRDGVLDTVYKYDDIEEVTSKTTK